LKLQAVVEDGPPSGQCLVIHAAASPPLSEHEAENRESPFLHLESVSKTLPQLLHQQQQSQHATQQPLPASHRGALIHKYVLPHSLAL
jgi:hypothetical protein